MVTMSNSGIGKGAFAQLPNYVTAEQCQQWCDLARRNEDNWETHFEYLHSYGSAWYLEIEGGRLHYYHANAPRTNQMLQELPDLVPTLASVGTVLAGPDGKTGYPVRPRRVAKGPYWSDAGVVMSTRGTLGEAHADYEGLAPHPEKLFDPSTIAFSAIISLAVPAAGGHLTLWPKRVLANECFEEDSESLELRYEVGTLTVFDSFCFHRIQGATMDDSRPYRMIAGMHFLFIDGPEPHWEHWF